MSSTSNGTQVIATINNLNMEGKFDNTNISQLKNLNTSEIIYYNDNLNNATPEIDKNIKIYDCKFDELDTFTPTTNIQGFTDFIQNDLSTSQELINTFNTLYKCKIYYNNTFNTSNSGFINIIYNNNGSVSSVSFTTDTYFSLNNNADTTASNLTAVINNNTNLKAEIDLVNKLIIVSTKSNINLSLYTFGNNTNNTNHPSLKIENYEKVFNVLPTDINNLASTLFTAEIVYNDNLFTSTDNDHSIELYYDGGSVTFNMITSGTSLSNEFLQESNVDTTAINLNNTINDYTDSNLNNIFSAEIDTVNKKITVRTTSNSDISLVNNSITGDGFTSITNFLHEIYYKNFETELVYNNDIATSINEHSVELYYDETNSVTFNMITSGIPSSTEFLQENYAYKTAINLNNAINSHPNFTNTVVNFEQPLYTFGNNHYGQLGLGNSTTGPYTPTKIDDENATDIIAVSCGDYHTAIVKSDGTVYTFGRNINGQLGLGDITYRDTPTQIKGYEDIIAVSCGGGSYGNISHTAILKSDGTVYTFGNNGYGQLGLGLIVGVLLKKSQ